MHRCAVVTGANKDIGLEIVRQLASHGMKVVLTARSETKGREAVSKLHQMGLTNVIFHQLDVFDPSSTQNSAKFIQDKFGRLEILVNNAATNGVVVDEEGLRALNIDPESWRVPNENIRNELGNVETLTEEKIDIVLMKFLQDLKGNSLAARGWNMMVPAYSISKVALNAYTRILAKKHPNMLINCVHPGFINTDLNWHAGIMTTEDGARGPVMLAFLPEGSLTGCYFDITKMAEF